MAGVTGRMGTNQHLVRSILAIRQQGGTLLSDGTRVMPDPILIGRNPEKVSALAQQYGISRWATDLDNTYENSSNQDLLSPNIDLTTATGRITLNWWNKHNIE